MALSNWNTFAMNHKEEPCNGKFISPSGIEVEIYKRWIYVKDKECGKNCNRPDNTVMQIYESRLNYKDVEIVSIFKNYTLYMAVWSGFEDEDLGTDFSGMVGIGASKITQKEIEKLHRFLNSKSIIHEIYIPSILKGLDLSKGKRFNQGDMFFHKKIGLDLQCTKVGEEKESHFSKFIKGMNERR